MQIKETTEEECFWLRLQKVQRVVTSYFNDELQLTILVNLLPLSQLC